MIFSANFGRAPAASRRSIRSARASRVSSCPVWKASSHRAAQSVGMPSASTHGRRSAFDHDLAPERGVDPARFRHVSLSHARPGGSAIADGVDQARRVGRSWIASAGRFNCSRLIEHLMSTPTGPGIDVRRRDHHAADRRTVAHVGVGVQHHVGHARRQPRMDGLPKRLVVEGRANRLGADHGDRTDVAGRQDGRGFSGGNQSWFVLSCHAWPSILVSTLYHLPPMAGVDAQIT